MLTTVILLPLFTFSAIYITILVCNGELIFSYNPHFLWWHYRKTKYSKAKIEWILVIMWLKVEKRKIKEKADAS